MEAEVYWVPGPWSGHLGIVPRPRGGDWLADEIRRWREVGLGVVASLLTPEEVAELELRDEEARCHEQGMDFYTFPIADRGVPQSRADMVELVKVLEKALESGKNVAVHCRQGIGRSALMAASLLVAAGEEPDQAFHNIERVRGTPVPETNAQREWVREMPTADELARRLDDRAPEHWLTLDEVKNKLCEDRDL